MSVKLEFNQIAFAEQNILKAFGVDLEKGEEEKIKIAPPENIIFKDPVKGARYKAGYVEHMKSALKEHKRANKLTRSNDEFNIEEHHPAAHEAGLKSTKR